MSHEFEVHHLVSELVSLLNAKDTASVDSCVELLLKNRTPYVTAQLQDSTYASKRRLAEFSSQGEQFISKYEELKIKQTRNLNPLVYLLSKLSEDADLCTFLRETRPPVEVVDRRKEIGGEGVKVVDLVEGAEVELPEKGAVLTEQELDELRGRLETLTNTMAERGKPKPPSPPSHFPQLPQWLDERRFLTRDFVATPTLQKGVALGTLPVAMQQHVILDDLLSILVGMDGRYIHPEPLPPSNGYRTFSVDPALDSSLRTLVTRTLPLASHYSIVQRFVQERSKFIHGMVNQGMCSAVQTLLKEYLVVVAQLESQHLSHQLTLQKLWYYVQPCLKTLDILSRVCVAVSNGGCRGGKSLTTLHTLTTGYIGDQRSQEICLYITKAACRPYLTMLALWIHHGIVNDPYTEFMIVQHEAFKKDRLSDEYNDAYWERRYTVAQESTPSFLEHLAERVLQTGKYLNVVRECGVEVACPGAQELSYSVAERHYAEQVDLAYSYASQELLRLMIEDNDLRGHLLSMKHAFLLDQGDLIVHFLDMAEEELSKPVADILPQRLESLLELAVRTSLLDNDPYKDKLFPLLVPYDLVTQLLYILAIQPEGVGSETPPPILRPDPSTQGLSGIEALTLDYRVGWPLSLVISRKCLFKYQMLFRHLFSCKHVERKLGAAWSRHRQAKTEPLLAHPWYASSYALLQRMLHFVQNLQYYMTFEVLEPNWVLLEKNLSSVRTIDDVLSSHGDFLDRSLRDCLLSDKEMLKIISRLMTICLQFTDYLKQVDMTQEQHKGKPSLTQLEINRRRLKPVASAPAILPSGEVLEGGADPHTLRNRLLSNHTEDLIGGYFEESILRLDEAFTSDVVSLLDKLYELSGQTVGGMISRLDFNGFYRGHMKSHDVT